EMTSAQTPSGQPSPTPSLEILHEKRVREEDLEDTTSRKNQKLDTAVGSVDVGLHKLTPGVPAADFVLPPAFGHTQLFDGQTKVFVPEAERAILDGM
ncbi:hypothetical protein A2U01_0052737, partial [Trifolium medium]|nr:hypothetical protein [Trifolium medium]